MARTLTEHKSCTTPEDPDTDPDDGELDLDVEWKDLAPQKKKFKKAFGTSKKNKHQPNQEWTPEVVSVMKDVLQTANKSGRSYDAGWVAERMNALIENPPLPFTSNHINGKINNDRKRTSEQWEEWLPRGLNQNSAEDTKLAAIVQHEKKQAPKRPPKMPNEKDHPILTTPVPSKPFVTQEAPKKEEALALPKPQTSPALSSSATPSTSAMSSRSRLPHVEPSPDSVPDYVIDTRCGRYKNYAWFVADTTLVFIIDPPLDTDVSYTVLIAEDAATVSVRFSSEGVPLERSPEGVNAMIKRLVARQPELKSVSDALAFTLPRSNFNNEYIWWDLFGIPGQLGPQPHWSYSLKRKVGQAALRIIGIPYSTDPFPKAGLTRHRGVYVGGIDFSSADSFSNPIAAETSNTLRSQPM